MNSTNIETVPQPNEVWRLTNGRYGLIVQDHGTEDYSILYWDEDTRKLTIITNEFLTDIKLDYPDETVSIWDFFKNKSKE